MTKSESIFESILFKRNIAFKKIPEEITRTPDYEVHLGNLVSYWEIKELEENPDEKEIQKQIKTNSHGLYKVNSLRVTNSISSACGQFKEYGVTDHPCVVVIFDARAFSVKDIILYQFIQSAMLGTAEYMENKEGVFFECKRNHGLLTNRKKYISAVALLVESTKELNFFHNPNASIPLQHDNNLPQFKNHFHFIKENNGFVWRKV